MFVGNSIYNHPLANIDVDVLEHLKKKSKPLPTEEELKAEQLKEKKKVISKSMQDLYDSMGGNCYDSRRE